MLNYGLQACLLRLRNLGSGEKSTFLHSSPRRNLVCSLLKRKQAPTMTEGGFSIICTTQCMVDHAEDDFQSDNNDLSSVILPTLVPSLHAVEQQHPAPTSMADADDVWNFFGLRLQDDAVEEHADDFDGEIFVYRRRGAPRRVTDARIDKSADEIEDDAFEYCKRLVQVETHDGLRRVGKWAFRYCKSLQWINLKSAVDIGKEAFFWCENLESVEFGDRLETIGHSAFQCCNSLKHLKLPSIITIGHYAFGSCRSLTDVELSERLELIGRSAFWHCKRLLSIAIPLKRDLFEYDDEFQRHCQFDDCEQLETVDLVGGAHKTVASLHMESWRTEMITEINRINQVLPNTPAASEKGDAIQQWMESLLDKMDRYKAEHCRYVKEGINLLELALWKAKLCQKEDSSVEGSRKKAVVDESVRKEKRITCGADIVIKNVLPFLQLE